MQTVVITGANRGIGLELARQLKDRGDQIIGLCRQRSEALESLGIQIEEGIDVGSDSVVSMLETRFRGISVDVLINNAGVLEDETLEDMNFSRIRRQLEINSLGPLRVTTALLDNLHKGSKVAIITSRMGSIADNTSGSRYGYRMSKAAVNMAGVSLAHDLAPRGISVALLHPGFVQTDMTAHSGNVLPAEAARALIARIDGLTLETSGSFWHANGEGLPW